LPVIGQKFNRPITTVEWIITIYLLVLSGLLLSFGRLGDMRGHKMVYMTGFFIFIASSMICGLSTSVTMLILFRAIQATGAAMISSNSPAILTKSFPASQRGQALGLQATMTYLGLTVGPSLGGWLTNQFTWRSVFYINVPVGALAVYFSWRFIRADREHTQERFDLAGAGAFIIGLVMFLFALNQGPVWGWTSLPILALGVLSLFILALFVYIEAHSPNPMLDLNLFHNKVFSLSTVSAILNYICVYTILFLMPFYLINGRNLSSGQAGLLLTAQPIIMAIVAPISGTLSDRIGARLPGMFGMAMLAAGLFLLSRLGPGSSYLEIIFALAVSGLGTGTFISPNNSALMGSAPKNRQGIAAGTLATARNFGMALGVGLAGAIYSTVLTRQTALGNPQALFAAFSATFLAITVVGIIGVFTTGAREA
jgi:EmrB/QacA subfamily drug resistance transporter